MFKYLERLRAKPERERRKAILLISLGVTLVVALFWGISLSFRLNNTDFSFQSKDQTESKVPSLGETFSTFIDQLGTILNNSMTIENTASDTALTAE